MRRIENYEEPFRQYPALRVLAAFACGIAYGEAAYSFWCQRLEWLMAAAVVGAVAAVVLRHRARVFPWVAYGWLFALGVLWQVADRRADAVHWPAHAATMRAVVAARPEATPGTWRVRAFVIGGEASGRCIQLALQRDRQDDLGVAAREVGAGRTKLGAASHQEPSDRTAAPALGSVLLFHAEVSPPRNAGNPDEFDYASYLRRQGVDGTAFAPQGRWRVAAGTMTAAQTACLPALRRVQLWAKQVQQAAAERFFRYLGHREAGVAAAMTLAERTALSDAEHQRFSVTGVSHVLALSGLHLSVLVGLLFGLAPRGRRWRTAYALMAIGLVWSFALVAGLPLSLVRAAGMFTFFWLAQAAGRRPTTLQSLFVVALVVLLLSPGSLFDVGWQMSFSAVLFIGLFVPPLRRRWARSPRLRRWQWLLLPLAVSVVAQAGTLPFVLYYFHQFPVYFLLANLLVVPLTAVVLHVALLFLLWPAGWTAAALHVVVRALLWVPERVSQWPGSTLEFHPSILGAACMFVGLLLLFVFIGTRRCAVALAACAAGLLMWGAEAYDSRPARVTPTIVFYHCRRATPVHFIASARHSYLLRQPSDSAGLAAIARTFWRRRQLAAPMEVKLDSFADARLILKHGRVRFGGQTVVFLPEAESWMPIGAEQHTVCDVLYVGPAYRGPLTGALRHFRPAHVVLSSGLPAWRRREYAHRVERAGIRCHNVARCGAWRLVLPRRAAW